MKKKIITIMSDFDYPKEMVYGKKHLKKLQFDKKKYDFVKC